MSEASVFRTLREASSELEEPVVTIGNFDGVHRGHQRIIRRARASADERGTRAVALTFDPHPVRYFRPEVAAFRLTTSAQRAKLLLDYGVDAVVELPFDEWLSSLEPSEFVDEILNGGLGARDVVVGEDFAFGKGRAGSTDDLERLCRQRGIDTQVCDHLEVDGESVSSTRIRNLIDEASLEQVNSLQGRPYRILGEVVHGDKRGRDLGFPTANIQTPNPVLPPNGIYVTTLHLSGYPSLQSVTSIGVRPTFGGGPITVESHVLDYDDELDIYDESVGLDFWSHLREERDYDEVDALVAQMERDVEEARVYFGL